MSNSPPDELPYNVKQYIRDEHEAEAQSLLADHRPVPMAVIDGITHKLTARWAAGQEFLATISPEDAARCRRFFRKRYDDPYGYHVEKLTEFVALGKWVLAPRWASVLDKMRAMREAVL